MRVELRITSGSRAGQRELFDKSVISIGRHPLNDLRFDPERDPDASSRHAEIRILGDKATLHDLDSTNGTFVNGQRVAGERALFDGDLMSFGREGPAVEFHAMCAVAAPDKTHAAPAEAAAPIAAARASTPRRDTTARIADAVQAQTGALRRMVIGLGAIVVLGAGAAYWIVHRESAQSAARVDELLKRNDSLSAMFEKTVGSMKGRVAGLDSGACLVQAQRPIRSARASRARCRRAATRTSKISPPGSIWPNSGSVRSFQRGASIMNRSLRKTARRSFSLRSKKRRRQLHQRIGTQCFAIPGLVITNRHVVQVAQGPLAEARDCNFRQHA